jgi:hypothetical protein
MDMADVNLVDFYGRVARIEKDHARGYGFEAVGTLGRSGSTRRSKKSYLRFVMPMLAIVACSVGLKGAIYHQIGADLYQARVDNLMDGQGFDRLGGVLMQADPATVWVSDKLDATLGKMI